MNKIYLKVIATALALMFSIASMAQQQEVISTQGNTDTDGFGTVEWTLGETITGAAVGGPGIVTQGFHQPELLPSTAVPTVSEWGLISLILLLGNVGLVALSQFKIVEKSEVS